MYSPTRNASSNRKNTPLTMSFTSVCAPNPTAMPTTPAPATMGAMSTPSADRPISTAVTASVTKATLRRIGSTVRMRVVWPGSRPPGPLPWASASRRSIMALRTNQARSATSAITVTLNTPRRMRMPAVSPVSSCTRSMPRLRASTSTAMISSSTRRARTAATEAMLGTTGASSGSSGARCRCIAMAETSRINPNTPAAVHRARTPDRPPPPATAAARRRPPTATSRPACIARRAHRGGARPFP